MRFAFPDCFARRVLTAAAASVVLAAASVHAATIHTTALPAGVDSSFSKSTHAFMYLEGETLTQSTTNGDTHGAADDASHTFFRTGQSPDDSFWSSAAVYNSAGERYVSRGADSATVTNANAYWENLATGLQAGQYDVFIRAYPSSNGTQTFTLYAGDSRSAVDNVGATSAGSVTTTAVATPVKAWYKIGTVDLLDSTDTFRLRIDTSTSTIRFDTILFTGPQVPEPATIGFIAAAGMGALMRRRR